MITYYGTVQKLASEPPDLAPAISLTVTDLGGFVLADNIPLVPSAFAQVTFAAPSKATVSLVVDGTPYTWQVPEDEGAIDLHTVSTEIFRGVVPHVEEDPGPPTGDSTDATLWFEVPRVMGLEF